MLSLARLLLKHISLYFNNEVRYSRVSGEKIGHMRGFGWGSVSHCLFFFPGFDALWLSGSNKASMARLTGVSSGSITSGISASRDSFTDVFFERRTCSSQVHRTFRTGTCPIQVPQTLRTERFETSSRRRYQSPTAQTRYFGSGRCCEKNHRGFRQAASSG